MKIGILGYGKEGQSAEKYFTAKGHEVAVFDNFTPQDLGNINFNDFDLLMRSPSVHPLPKTSPFYNLTSSITRYFFNHCPAKIIGVTGTKGKGTTCSLITDLLKNLDQKTWLVGNIGNPALDVLDQIQPDDAVVYEMSSFQLWDLETSPHIAVLTTIEPDHLNVHDGYDDYVRAKANIAKHQTAEDYCIYYAPNPDSTKIAKQSHGTIIPYPITSARESLDELLSHLAIPGQHNRNNAEAALLAVASFLNLPLDQFIQQYHDVIIQTFANFQGLPHRLQYLRELNGVRYYDDNFSTTLTSLEVALKAFPEQKVVLIVGGRDKTNGEDLPKIVELINLQKVAKVILMGESGHELAKSLPDAKVVESLAEAITTARQQAEELANKAEDSANDTQPNSDKVVVLMSPAAASFDMFENVYARGAEYQKLIQELK